MSRIDQNSDETMPAGKPLDPDRAARKDDDGLGPVHEDEDEAGELTDADIENQAGTEATDPRKFKRDKAEGEDTTGPAQPR